MEKWVIDFLESEESVEKRLAEAEAREGVRAAGKIVGEEGRYADVREYDPVLRSHCRLEP